MENTMKKLLSVVPAAALIFAAVIIPNAALAADASVFKWKMVKNGDVTYDGEFNLADIRKIVGAITSGNFSTLDK